MLVICLPEILGGIINFNYKLMNVLEINESDLGLLKVTYKDMKYSSL